MTRRSRRPSAYQPRPATLPPGTHFRRPGAVPTAEAGPENASPVVTVDEPAEPPIEQPVVVAEPHDDAEAPPADQPVVVVEPRDDAEGPPADQPVVVAEPHGAEGPPAQLDGVPPRRTRLPVLVFTAVVLVATLVAYLGWRLVGEDRQEAAPISLTSTRSPTPAPTPTPSVILSATASPSVDLPPVEAPDGGSYLEVTVLDSGDLEVDQWVRSSAPLTALRLSVPADPLVSDGVVASDLRASADGKQADVPTTLESAPAVITLAGVHQVHLTYRLAGALLRSSSRDDRALARTVALDLDLNGEPRREPTTFSFRGATALTVVCDGSANGAPVRCGRRDNTGDWQVRAAARGAKDRVMALLELPAPTAR